MFKFGFKTNCSKYIVSSLILYQSVIQNIPMNVISVTGELQQTSLIF